MTETDMQKVTETTAEILKKQPKVKVKLYLNPDEIRKLESQMSQGKNVQWPFTTVQINGYTYQIQLGKEVEVPQSVAEVLRNANMI